ncbi:hypothetical protein CDL15_Pgr004306 [Punica granatum]|uniref:Uncharacterized protein n=1 Tax=Punica granatum TaxID=22663 RepID=A0A218XF81_PUNGR|nr:hypothetical protein CDL15_Pgr004306 [Punica granatum]
MLLQLPRRGFDPRPHQKRPPLEIVRVGGVLGGDELVVACSDALWFYIFGMAKSIGSGVVKPGYEHVFAKVRVDGDRVLPQAAPE